MSVRWDQIAQRPNVILGLSFSAQLLDPHHPSHSICPVLIGAKQIENKDDKRALGSKLYNSFFAPTHAEGNSSERIRTPHLLWEESSLKGGQRTTWWVGGQSGGWEGWTRNCPVSGRPTVQATAEERGLWVKAAAAGESHFSGNSLIYWAPNTLFPRK